MSENQKFQIPKSRLEAFSDGVIAIIITIMVLEIKVPHGHDWAALKPLAPVFFTYILSFIYVGIYWNNHHHLLAAAKRINGAAMWANLHLLFWLSLLPFSAGFMGENHFEKLPTAIYGFVLLMASIAYAILARTLIYLSGKESAIAIAYNKAGYKEISSTILYAVAVILSFFTPVISLVIYHLVALIWVIPDSRIEKLVAKE
jgi:uncharacterized membrane protein